MTKGSTYKHISKNLPPEGYLLINRSRDNSVKQKLIKLKWKKFLLLKKKVKSAVNKDTPTTVFNEFSEELQYMHFKDIN